MIRYSLAICPVVVVVSLIGCSGFDLFHNQQTQEAQQRWSRARARVKLQLAEKTFTGGAVDDALKQCNEVVTLDPDMTDAYLLIARIRLEKGEVAKAGAALDAAELAALVSAESSYLRGIVAERRGRLDKALEHYQAAYDMNREELDFLLTYVECLIAADRHEEALRVIVPRLVDYEQTPAVHALTAQAFSLLGRHTRAAECMRLALHLAPANQLLREEVGITFLAAGWNPEAVETLMPLVQHRSTTQPIGEDASPSIGALQALTTALLRDGKPEQAATILEQNIQHCQDQASAWLLMAEAHLRSGSIEPAAYAAEKAVGITPGDSEGHLILAYCALETHRPDRAIEIAERLVRRDPNDIEARALLARAWEQTPNGTQKAAEQYRHILSVAPENRWARRQLQRLTQQAKAG